MLPAILSTFARIPFKIHRYILLWHLQPSNNSESNGNSSQNSGRCHEAAHKLVTKLGPFQTFFASVRNGKARQAKGFSFLTTQLTRWRSGVRARTGLPSILLILLNRGRESLRNLAKLVTIRHQLTKSFRPHPASARESTLC
jgi:hypothetical protein